MNANNKLTNADEPVIITLPNYLRQKTGGSLDVSLIAQAETAISSMSGNFDQWLEETVVRLSDARRLLDTQPITATNNAPLYAAALDTKGLGSTYGYPFISRFAASLCRMLARLPAGKVAPGHIVDAHIDAIRAVLRSRINSDNDPIGQRLAAELETQVNDFLK